LVEIQKGTTFSFATLQGDSFSLGSEETINLNVAPIGEL